MRIEVVFASGEIGQVQKHTLDHFILEDEVVAFRRSTGWVQVDRDPVRELRESAVGPGKRWSGSARRMGA